ARYRGAWLDIGRVREIGDCRPGNERVSVGRSYAGDIVRTVEVEVSRRKEVVLAATEDAVARSDRVADVEIGKPLRLPAIDGHGRNAVAVLVRGQPAALDRHRLQPAAAVVRVIDGRRSLPDVSHDRGQGVK